jgi:hypothetical protein
MNISGDKNWIKKNTKLLPITKEHLEHDKEDTNLYEDTDGWIHIPRTKEERIRKRIEASKITPTAHNYNQ